ncbi:MAG: type II toxin-antitoxin system VapC family toxin [Candidatus Lokiarchaeota archaeon]|nr:type II toxin-antitoxin system VapC family toxin [Candidatus Lokiarchaeota archaeon]
MKRVIIDASVVVKWFIEEEGSEIARTIRDKFVEGKIEFIVPSLLYFEVLNALKYSKLFPLNELNDAGESLENYGFLMIQAG